MAKKFYTDINLLKNELQNAAIQNLAAAPSDPVLGQVYFNTTDNEIYVCVDADAPTWESIGGDIESVTAGAGLTGGGTDGAVTLNVGEGTGITVNADEIKIKNADSLTDDTVVKWDDTNGQLVDTVITDDGTNVGINNTSPSVAFDVTGDTKFSGDSEFLNGNYITKSLPAFYMGGSDIDDEYLVICKQVVAIPSEEELEEGESQSDYYQDATGVTGRIYFSRGSENTFNNNGYLDIVAQVSRDSGNVNNLDLSEFKIVGDSLFFTQIEEIDIDGTKYLALKARASGGGSVNHFFFVGNLSDDGADTNILTRVRASDETVTVTDPQPSGFPIAPYMRQDEDGNVGIGTGTPSDKLDVHGIIAVDGAALIDKNNNTVTIGDIDGADDIGFLDINTANASTRVFLDDSGNVGINTSTPLSELHIVGENGTARIDNTSSTKSFSLTTMDSNNRFRIYDNTSDAERLTITNGGNVGIGTTSPATSLHVNGFARLAGSLQLAGSNRYVYTINDTDLLLGTYNTERMRITNTGNVGIGITSPIYKLDIQAGSDNTIARFKSTDDVAQIQISDDDTDTWIGSKNGLSYFSKTAGTPVNGLVVDASYNVGIGTLSPTQKLHVAGNAIIENSSGAELNLKNTSSGSQWQVVSGYNGGFEIGDVTNSLTDASAVFFITSSTGRVGIGTTAPAYKLDVNGTARVSDLYVSGNIIHDGDTNNRIIFGTDTQTFRTAGTDAITINDDQSLQFNSYGAGYLKSDASGNITVDSDTIEDTLDSVTDRGNTTSNSITTGNVTISTSATPILKIKDSGNGASGGAAGIIRFSNTVGEAIGIGYTADEEDNSDLLISTNAGSTYGGYLGLDANAINDPSSIILDPKTNLLITNGNVGIGTSSPTEKLAVDGNIETTASAGKIGFNVGDAYGDFPHYGLGKTNGANPLNLAGYYGLTFGSNGAERMRITQSGNVGIGTASPSEKLHVSGDVRIEGDLTVNGSYTQIDTDVNTTEQWNVTNDGTGPAVTINQTGSQDIMDVQDDGTSVFYIEDGGNVGIGTTDPTTTLDVRGDITVQDANTPTISLKDTTNDLVGRLRAANSYVYLTADHGDTVNASRIVLQVDGDSSAYFENGLFAAETSVQFTTYGSGSETGTPAYALAVDSSGNVIETTVQSSPAGIDGTGTVGYLTKWSTTDTITDSVIAESSGNIGIGTTSPSGKLHIQTDGYSEFIFTGASTSGYATTFHMDNTGLDIGHNSTGRALNLKTGSLDRLTITGGGNVGIGTTSPSEKLHVDGGMILVGTDSGDAFNASALVGIQGTNAAYFQAKSSTTGFAGLLLGDTDDDYHAGMIYANDTSILTFNAGNSTRLAIDGTSGNVGIGTTSPDYPLTVYNASGAVLKLDSGGANNSQVRFHQAGTLKGAITYIPANDQIRIYNEGDVLTIGTSNVGIGTTSPAAKLEVVGDTYLRTQLFTDTIRPYSADQLTLLNGNNNYLYVNGNVGIGATSPSVQLDIEDSGNVLIDLNTTTANANTTIRFQESGSNTATIGYNGTADGLVLANGGFTAGNGIFINGSNNVGIGTSSPVAPLDVSSASNGNRIILRSTVAPASTPSMTIGTQYYYTGTTFTGGSQIVFEKDNATAGNYGHHLQFWTRANGSSASEKMRITSDGKVGIGTTSPASVLHIKNSVPEIVLEDSDVANRKGKVLANNGNLGLFADSDNVQSDSIIYFNIDSSEKMRINADGNVGIGTTSPENKLHVYGGRIVIDNAANAQSAIQINSAGSEKIVIYRPTSTEDLRIYTPSAGDAFTLTQSGNVGIGTTSPGSKLTVSGDIFTTAKFVTDSNELLRIYQSSWTGNEDHLVLYNAWKSGTGDYLLLKSSGNQDGNNGAMIIADGNGGRTFFGRHSNEDAALDSSTSPLDETYAFIGSTATYFSSNVGIGTTSPDAKLVVSDGTNINFKVGQLSHQTVANPGVGVTFSRTSSDAPLMAMGVLEDDDLGVMSRNTIQFLTGGVNNYQYTTERMRIHADGNVSVGTTNAYARFSVKATSHNNGISVNRQADNTAAIYIGNDGGNNPVLAANNADMLFGRDLSGTFTERMRLTNGGNLGIGTTAPTASLHIGDGSGLSSLNVNDPYLMIGLASSVNMAFDDNEIQVRDNGAAAKLIIQKHGGNVGIGLSSPTKTLDISGNLRINEGDAFTDLDIKSDRSSGNIGGVNFVDSGNNITGQIYGNVDGTVKISSGGSSDDNTSVGITVNNDQTLIFNGYTAGYLKSDASGNITVDTSTIEDTLDSVTDRGNTTTNDIEVGNITTKNDSGIYSFSDTVDASSSEDIFSISNEHGSQAFRVTFVCNTAGYSVAKTFEVVHGFGKDPVFFKVVDTGAYNSSSADHDFDVSFTNSNSNTGVTCEITNNSTTINADIVSTVFLGGSPTAITVTAL